MMNFSSLLALSILMECIVHSCALYLQDENQEEHISRRLNTTASPACVTVIDSSIDLVELCYTFQTLVRAKGFPAAPILAFHGLPLSDNLLDILQGCTNCVVTFVYITTFYSVFPESFEPTPGTNYDQQQTDRFFITDLWTLPHVEAHDVIIRISDSSCLSLPSDDLPDFPSTLPAEYTKEALMYQTQIFPGSFVIGYRFIANLYDSTFAFVSANNIYPRNPASCIVEHCSKVS